MMLRRESRKTIYCLPFIVCSNDIRIGTITIKPIKALIKDENCKELLKEKVFGDDGCVIEIDGFRSGDFYNKNIDIEINRAIEALKASYFYCSPPSIMNIKGFIGNETFECFQLIEKMKPMANTHFEHKIQFSNGMSNFYLSLDKYYKFRAEFIDNFKLRIHKNDFMYYGLFYECISIDQVFSVVRLYNKCWGLYSANDFFDKALYSRVSIEVLSKFKFSKGSKPIHDAFKFIFLRLRETIEGFNYNDKNDKFLYSIYLDNIKPCFDSICNKIERYFFALADARNYIAHEGKEHSNFLTISPYLIFFPVFFTLLSQKDETTSDVYRYIFLLGLFMYDVETWDDIDFSKFPTRRSHLDSYLNWAKVYPKYLEHNKEAAYCLLLGFKTFIEDAKKP
jgi:hypothetical protein